MEKKIFYAFLIFGYLNTTSQELIIGQETIEPGIVFIFEGAVKDHVMPSGMHLEAVSYTHLTLPTTD